MTDAFSASELAATGQLAAAIERVTGLAAKLDRRRDEVLAPSTLHLASGVPVDVIEALLEGEPAGERDIQRRFLQRLDLLSRTHVKENGRKFTQGDIANETGISRQQINALFNGERRPTMVHCSQIERFFQRPAGFLQSEDSDALLGALLAVEKKLLEEYAARESVSYATPSIFERHGVEGIALRAALLPTDHDRQKVLEWLDWFMSERSTSTPDES